MNWGITGLLVIFGAFIALLILNPNLSCFGKRIRSPFYPLFRRKKGQVKTSNYGFRLVEGSEKKSGEPEKKKTVQKTDDYGFRLD